MVVVELLVTIILTSVVASEQARIAKPECDEQCGNVKIPFPFGIGLNCAVDERFEIVCNKSTIPHRPYLKKVIQLEVLHISVEKSQVRVGSPISFFDCPDKKTRQPVNLTGSPFYYLETGNRFVAVSCDVLAVMESTLSNKFFVGCRSTCSAQNNITANSNDELCVDDVDCCHTFISAAFYSIEISIYNNGTRVAPDDETTCKFVFFVEKEYLKGYLYNSTSYFVRIIRSMDYVPVVMSWNLILTPFKLFNSTYEETNKRGIECDIPALNPDIPYTFPNQTQINQCKCRDGFRGNPYLIDGCEDINECDEMTSRCNGNGGTCVNTYGSYHCNYKRKFVLIGIGSAVGALVLLFGMWGVYKFIKKRRDIKRKKKHFKRNGGLLLEQQISSGENNIEKTKLFSSNELEKATDHFSLDRILGQGGQGTVYKGMLEDGKIVAVKKSTIIDEAKLSEFINEVVILSQINHRNVVKLFGCCLETDVPLLVYEFIPNGTLSEYIHESNEEFPFTWKMRLGIATEVAGALSYLHSAASFPIYHRDIKSTNILLDEKYKAKVADFGTSRTISLEQTHLTTIVYGTFGYLDPEYFQSSQFTEKSDVYSFGVVLVELLTGQKAVSITRSEERRSLATYFRIKMEEDGLFDILDAQVLKDAPREEIIIVADLAQRCLYLNGRSRPTMKEVAMELEGIQRRSKVQQNYEELEFVRTKSFESNFDVGSTSTGSTVDSTATRSSLQQELPLMSFESR